MRTVIEAGLNATLDAQLVRELLDAHAEAKRNYYLGGLRLQAVEGGRFCEAAFRILQQVTTGTFDPLGRSLSSTDALIQQLARLSPNDFGDSIRLHIPRSLRVVYDIRNKRNTAHLSDAIDPNLQDATLVVSVIDWVLGEFVRLYHNVSADEAQSIVEGLVTRMAPAIQDFDGFLKVLRTGLRATDLCVLLLYQRGATGATFAEILNWSYPKMRANLRRTISTLVNDKLYAHVAADRYRITQAGQRYVEKERLFDPE